jgi:hypothetical protein
VQQVRSKLGVSERRACQVIGQPRSTQRRVLRVADDEERLTAAIIELATLTDATATAGSPPLLRAAGWVVNKKRVERIWRREGARMCRRNNPRRAAVAQRRLLPPAPAGAGQPCLGL